MKRYPSSARIRTRLWWHLTTILVVALAAASLLPGPAAHADQALPPYAWYAVVWQTPADTLHWVGPLGEVASIQRPTLPNEAPNSEPQVAISPNGEYAVIAATLADNRQGLGIYDLGAGQFTQTHEAQVGETITLGSPHIFNRTNTRVAVGLRSGDFPNPAWRVIVFDLASGDVAAVLDHTNPTIGPVQLSTPYVRYYGVFEGQAEEVVHFQLIPYGVGGSLSWPAYAWLPTPAPANAANAVTPSTYTRAESDIQFLSGEELFAFEDPNYGTLAQQGPAPSLNAIGRQMPGAPSPTSIWVDGTAYNYRARWAAGSQGALYWSDNGQGMQNWNTISANGTPQANNRTLLGPAITDAVGTPDGFLMQAQGNFLYHSTNLQDASGSLIFQGGANQTMRIIYVTPGGVQFTLTSLGDGGGVVGGPGDIVAPPQGCPGAPPQRLTVGEGARVTFTNGQPLNLRSQPGGGLVATLQEGTEATVLSGPVCQDSFSWWQLSVVAGAAVSGWAAEGDLTDYYLEPWQTGGVGPAGAAGNLTIAPTATPLQLQIVTVVPPATPVVSGPNDIQSGQNCRLAPPPQLQIGMPVIAASGAGTYALRYNLNDPVPQHQVLPGTQGTVVGGPACKDGYRLWQFQFNLNNELVTGWVSEGTQAEYFVIPWF